MTRVVGVLIAAGLLIVSGVVAGMHSDRWGVSEAREQAAAALARIPTVIGTWRGEETPLDERQTKRAECDAACSRVYRRMVKGERQEATLIALSGRSQPISVHSPDVCFQGAGYHMDGPAQRVALGTPDQGKHEFWSARFIKPPETVSFQVFWGWSDGRGWRAPDDARLMFRRAPALYKLYVVGVHPRRDGDPDPAREFLQELLPELQRRLTES